MMVEIYRTSCNSCKALFEVKYGSKNENIVYEVYSCSKCKNMFSLTNSDKEMCCPKCGTKDLKQYNMNKDKNIRYYKKMMREGLLTAQKYNNLVKYWNNVESSRCPNCDKETLIWRCYEKIK